MSSKRNTPIDHTSAGLPPAKKSMTQFEPVKIGPVYSLEDMDIKVLQFQNRKLVERIDQRRRAEDDLKRRIEQLEQRQATDDAVLCIVNRYWNQLDEDVRVLLQRFDAEGADEAEKQNESTAVTSFLTLLSQWDQREIEDKLCQRVEFSERAIGKLIQAFDRLLQRKEKLWDSIRERNVSVKEEAKEEQLKSDFSGVSDSKSSKSSIQARTRTVKEELSLDEPIKNDGERDLSDLKSESGMTETSSSEKAPVCDSSSVDDREKVAAASASSSESRQKFSLTEALKIEMNQLMVENKRLHDMVTELHQKNHKITLKNSELQDRLAASETEAAELANSVEDLEYHLATANHRADKLDKHLTEVTNKLKNYQEGDIKVQDGGEGVSKNKFNEMMGELEEQKELATGRLGELEKLQDDHQQALREMEKLKMDLSTLPESVVIETTEYKCLQSQFSVLYNEATHMKTQLDEARNLLLAAKTTHIRQIEQMELEELAMQKKLRTEMIQMEDQHAQVRRDYDLLRMEFEQTLAANEQTGPINREMRNLISSLKNNNEQLKGEIQRYKRKLKETQGEVNKLRQDQHNSFIGLPPTNPSQQPSTANESTNSMQDNKKNLDQDKSQQLSHHSSSSSSSVDGSNKSEKPASSEKEPADSSMLQSSSVTTATTTQAHSSQQQQQLHSNEVKELRFEIKKLQDKEREMKLHLDVYKNLPKEQRDKGQLMASERKARLEVDELRIQIRRMNSTGSNSNNSGNSSGSAISGSNSALGGTGGEGVSTGGGDKKDGRKKSWAGSEDHEVSALLRKIKKMEEAIVDLQKCLSAQKQEEEAMLNEMEVTGQAFEDMQEQNVRLLQQLREKDDANFKLMSERIKASQLDKLLRDEKDILAEQVETLQHQVEAQNLVVRKLEEKERLLMTTINSMDKELTLRQQAMEMHKRKAVEYAQTSADLKLHLDKYQVQLKEIQLVVTDKTTALQQQGFKFRRMQEDLATMRKKLDRVKKIEMASSADEVLMEEIREYKEQLTCPSCKVKKKDAVLTKCFHVFCLECLKTRYETRQRKCPKCNATFGANDYHRIYLE